MFYVILFMLTIIYACKSLILLSVYVFAASLPRVCVYVYVRFLTEPGRDSVD